VDCTDFNEEEKNYFVNNCDYVLNLWKNQELHPNIFGISKALGVQGYVAVYDDIIYFYF